MPTKKQFICVGNCSAQIRDENEFSYTPLDDSSHRDRINNSWLRTHTNHPEVNSPQFRGDREDKNTFKEELFYKTISLPHTRHYLQELSRKLWGNWISSTRQKHEN
jgi:hypothetical protein